MSAKQRTWLYVWVSHDIIWYLILWVAFNTSNCDCRRAAHFFGSNRYAVFLGMVTACRLILNRNKLCYKRPFIKYSWIVCLQGRTNLDHHWKYTQSMDPMVCWKEVPLWFQSPRFQCYIGTEQPWKYISTVHGVTLDKHYGHCMGCLVDSNGYSYTVVFNARAPTI